MESISSMLKTETPYQKNIILDGSICSNTSGITKLLDWYHQAASFSDVTLYTCCKELEWLDANLAALWSALIFKLRKERNLTIILDEATLAKNFSILIRNGFSQPAETVGSTQGTFIRNACFASTDEQAFEKYVASELLQQKQIKYLPLQLKSLMEQNLYELYLNVESHAKTTDPLFICGQYYPKLGNLVVSVVDLGRTFLPGIQERTNGIIKTQAEAIHWALKGNSEFGKENGGGHALKCIRECFEEKGHSLQIVTGNGFWDSGYASSLMGADRILNREMPGTMVSFSLKIDPTYKKA